MSSFSSFSVYFRKKLQVWNCERRTHVQSPKSTLFKVSRMFADEYLLFIPPAIPCSLISGDDWTILSGLWRLKFAAPPLTLLMAGAPEPGRSLTSPRSPARVVTYANLFTRREQMFSQSSANNIPRGI